MCQDFSMFILRNTFFSLQKVAFLQEVFPLLFWPCQILKPAKFVFHPFFYFILFETSFSSVVTSVVDNVNGIVLKAKKWCHYGWTNFKNMSTHPLTQNSKIFILCWKNASIWIQAIKHQRVQHLFQEGKTLWNAISVTLSCQSIIFRQEYVCLNLKKIFFSGEEQTKQI